MGYADGNSLNSMSETGREYPPPEPVRGEGRVETAPPPPEAPSEESHSPALEEARAREAASQPRIEQARQAAQERAQTAESSEGEPPLRERTQQAPRTRSQRVKGWLGRRWRDVTRGAKVSTVSGLKAGLIGVPSLWHLLWDGLDSLIGKIEKWGHDQLPGFLKKKLDEPHPDWPELAAKGGHKKESKKKEKEDHGDHGAAHGGGAAHPPAGGDAHPPAGGHGGGH
ncbi:MAG: hypothetical protein UY77_C0008G0013 [Candidatus Uhrbacteria bacterium GW2011_GWA2_53_10]|uniref:Uncharacterized protein n=1 Tax=Candidatus Uhrbacteria bacterium GW2011_GWA2_53_10 TaxID=1618980 RepID=A0A0G1XPY0_9BACT|nr:MAG: hypothetical protein UY77_C0008G0013 [Candidatus Uhrbacteria bacterium GW2011_GWA2_53_10]